MEKYGLKVYTSVKVVSISKKPSGDVTTSLSNRGTIEGTQILIVAGRVPKTTGIGLERFNVSTNGKPVEVDKLLCVKGGGGQLAICSWVYQ